MSLPFAFVQHADWSVAPAKRWTVRAWRDGAGWRADGPDRVGDPAALLDRAREAAAGGAALVGLDFPIGLPRALRAGRDLRAVLAGFAAPDSRFLRLAGRLEEACPEAPFFPAGTLPAGARKVEWLARIGLDFRSLLRECDRGGDGVRPACGLFWCVGANQVGKAAIAGWRELVIPALARPEAALWPFDGPLAALAVPGRVVLAETYPAEAYGRVLGPDARVRKNGPTNNRAGQAAALHAWADRAGVALTRRLHAAIDSGFAGQGADDAFDAMLGLAGMIDIVAGRHAEGTPDDPEIRAWEGWMLGRRGGQPL